MREWFAWAARQTYGDLPSVGKPEDYADPLCALAGALSEFGGELPGLDDEGEGDSLSRALDVDWPLPNVWLGVSVEDQRRAEERIPHLLATPAAVRFLSCEPLLGPVAMNHWTLRESGLRAIGAPPGLRLGDRRRGERRRGAAVRSRLGAEPSSSSAAPRASRAS
jgi:hypothetical protein